VIPNPGKLKGLVVDGEINGGLCVGHRVCPTNIRCDL
jgi:hypothetical protein